MIQYPPPPTSNFFSSDFGNSHDLAELGLGARASPRGYATEYLCIQCNGKSVFVNTKIKKLVHNVQPYLSNYARKIIQAFQWDAGQF